MGDDLREHRVEERRDLGAGLYPGVDSDIDPVLGRELDGRDGAGGRTEVLRRVLGVETRLDGVPVRHQGLLYLVDVAELSGAEPQHHLDDVLSVDHLGDAVLDLEPGVDLKEVELLLVGVEYVLDGAGAAVMDGLAERDSGRVKLRAGLRREVRCRALLDDLLVAALGRAVTLAYRDDLALAVTEDLNLDVAGMLDELLDEHAARGEVVLRKHADFVERIGELLRAVAALHADSAAARGALEHHRVADSLSCGERLFGALEKSGSRRERHSGLPRDLAGLVLEAERDHLLFRRSEEHNALLRAAGAEVRVLREEAVAGVDRLGAGLFNNLEDFVLVEVGIRDCARSERVRLIGVLHMEAVTVSLVVNGN